MINFWYPLSKWLNFETFLKTCLMTDLHLTLVTSKKLVLQEKSVYRSKAFTHDNIIKAKKSYVAIAF